VRLICAAMDFDYDTQVKYDSSFADGQFKKTVSNARLLDAYKRTTGNDYAFIKLEEGLPETVKWFVSNFDKVRK
jgi:GDP-L-fucose synthase